MIRRCCPRAFALLPAGCLFWAFVLVMMSRVAMAQTPVVAAAADLQFALPELAGEFQQQTGEAVRLVFGSSGNLARQIEQGAPFALFLSADEALVAGLVRAGLTVDEGQVYGRGRLALFVPAQSPLAADPSLAGLAAALQSGRITRFAIPNPLHAPYGQRARELLRAQGLWEGMAAHLVLGENAAQAAQFALSGSVDAGISAWALAHAPDFAARGKIVLLPEEAHAPLIQRMVLLKSAGPAAQRFHAWLLGDEARATFKRFGFERPPGP